MSDHCEKPTGMVEAEVAATLARLRPADPTNKKLGDEGWAAWGVWCHMRDALMKLADDPNLFLQAAMA